MEFHTQVGIKTYNTYDKGSATSRLMFYVPLIQLVWIEMISKMEV